MKRKTPRGFTSGDLERAARILNLDLASGGRVWKAKCPIHGKMGLIYYYYEDRNQLIVRCSICRWQTSFKDEVYDDSSF